MTGAVIEACPDAVGVQRRERLIVGGPGLSLHSGDR